MRHEVSWWVTFYFKVTEGLLRCAKMCPDVHLRDGGEPHEVEYAGNGAPFVTWVQTKDGEDAHSRFVLDSEAVGEKMMGGCYEWLGVKELEL